MCGWKWVHLSEDDSGLIHPYLTVCTMRLLKFNLHSGDINSEATSQQGDDESCSQLQPRKLQENLGV